MNTSFEKMQLGDDTMLIMTGATLDNNNSHEMVAAIGEAQQKGFKNIVIDMAKLEFLSSAGVGSIIGTVEISREQGGDIILCNLADPIKHVLKVLDLIEFLTIANNKEAAVARCAH